MTRIMNRYATLAVLVIAGLLSACDNNKWTIPDLAGPIDNSRIRFFNFGVNAPSVNFYANEKKMTAISSTTGTESTTGIAYGGVGAGGAYASIAPGQYALAGKIAAATDKDLAISTVNQTIADGKFYSFYMSGFYNTTTKNVEGFVVEDNLPSPSGDLAITTVRFVHAISNGNPMTLYAKSTTTAAETAIGSEIAYKSAGAFVNIPAGAYDLSTRYTGSSTNAVARTGVSFVGNKVYTITARGDITVTPTTTGCAAANRTCLDNTANR
ncbi:MAG TPA: DUF4397 domain-containing protein [Gemmatimonadaceae bacterium]|nr:DUF4397 domain-containing protein [Gemmatimonadaceae bacterium]